jgi:hypothetical protein
MCNSDPWAACSGHVACIPVSSGWTTCSGKAAAMGRNGGGRGSASLSSPNGAARQGGWRKRKAEQWDRPVSVGGRRGREACGWQVDPACRRGAGRAEGDGGPAASQPAEGGKIRRARLAGCEPGCLVHFSPFLFSYLLSLLLLFPF